MRLGLSDKRLIHQLSAQYDIDYNNVVGHGELQPNRRNALEGGTIAREIRELARPPEGLVLDKPGAARPPLEPASRAPLGERQLSDQELVEVRGPKPTGEPQVRKPGTPEVSGDYTQVEGRWSILRA